MNEQELYEIRKHIRIITDLYGDVSENMAVLSVQLVLLLLFLFSSNPFIWYCLFFALSFSILSRGFIAVLYLLYNILEDKLGENATTKI